MRRGVGKARAERIKEMPRRGARSVRGRAFEARQRRGHAGAKREGGGSRTIHRRRAQGEIPPWQRVGKRDTKSTTKGWTQAKNSGEGLTVTDEKQLEVGEPPVETRIGKRCDLGQADVVALEQMSHGLKVAEGGNAERRPDTKEMKGVPDKETELGDEEEWKERDLEPGGRGIVG